MNFKKLFSKKLTDVASGLMIHDGLFRYIAIERTPESFSVVSALADNVGAGTLERQAEKVFSELKGFADNRIKISVSLPMSDSMLKIVDLPMDIEDAKLSMRYELEKFFPVNAENAMFDIADLQFPFAEQYEGKKYLVAAAKKSQVNELYDCARQHGFEIECIEPAQIALERAAALYSQHRAALLIYAGTRYMQQTLFWHGNGIAYRFTDLSHYEPVSEDIALLKAEKTDNYTGEINAFLEDSYNETKVKPVSVALFGPTADKGLALQLEQNLDINVDYVDILELNAVEMQDDEKLSKGYWDIPLGLALRHFDGC